jgi:integrase
MHHKPKWEQFEQEVLALYMAPIRRPATLGKVRQVLVEFGRICPAPSELTPATVAGWIAGHPGRRPATVDSLLRAFRSACNYAVERGWLRSNPLEFRHPSAWVDWDVPELPPPVHTAAEIASVLAKADSEAYTGRWRDLRLRAVVYAFAYTGARKQEIMGLRRNNVDLASGVISIEANQRRKLKTRHAGAHLPIPGPLHEVLAAWIPRVGCDWLFPGTTRIGPWLGGPFGGKVLDEVKALGLRAGVPNLTIASFRHTFASLSERWGIGELMLQRLLRHSRVRTQRVYRHEMPEVLVQAGERVHYP